MASTSIEEFIKWGKSLGMLMRENYRNWSCFWIALVAYVVLTVEGTPFVRYIPDDSWDSLTYPHRDSTVPSAWVLVIALAIPIVIVTLYHFVYGCEMQEYHDLLFSIMMTVALTGFTTEALKDGLGRPRPDFYERCFGYPYNGRTLPHMDPHEKLDCPNEDDTSVDDGRRSFPSGHSSWSMCSMFYLTLFFVGKLRAFDKRGHAWKWIVSMLPTCGAIVVGITRICDYRHHWTDVLGGWLLGILYASMVYLTYYPWPFSRNGTEVPLYNSFLQVLPQDSIHSTNQEDNDVEEGNLLRSGWNIP